MKTKYALLTGLAMLVANLGFGQIEHDDMYFNGKDRKKLNAAREELMAKQYNQENKRTEKLSPINPTESYSGRSVNPEYTNRLKTNSNLESPNSNYFVPGYQPLYINQNTASNGCNCINNNYFNSPYGGYGMNYFNGMNSYNPFNDFYSPWGMGNGYNQSGWSSMVGYNFGGMNSGWYGGLQYGYGNSWGSPWGNGFGSSFYSYNNYGYGVPFGWGNNYYGNNFNGNTYVIINNQDSGNPVVYGKRSNRSSDYDNVIDRSRPTNDGTRSGRVASGGRSGSSNQSEYYDRGWKRDPEKNPTRSAWVTSSGNTNSSSRSGSSNSSYTNSSSSERQSSSFDVNGGSNSSSRSSFSSGSSDGGSRSSGSSSGSSSSGSSSSGGSRRGRD